MDFEFQDILPDLENCQAPKFGITTIDNFKFKQNGSNDHVFVINFWFMGCKPCVEEIPLMNELVDDYQGKKVVFLALNPVDSRETIIRHFFPKHNLKYEIAPIGRDIVKRYCVFMYPSHFVLDQDSKVIRAFAASLDNDDNYNKIKTGIDLALSTLD